MSWHHRHHWGSWGFHRNWGRANRWDRDYDYASYDWYPRRSWVYYDDCGY